MVLVAGGALAQGADDCSSAQLIAGTGTFAFDNTGTTTDGPGGCDVGSDVWYLWYATATSDFIYRTCGQVTFDSYLAVYDGASCPSAVELGCNDDACALQSSIQFHAVGGTPYLLRAGGFGGAQGSGNIEIVRVGDGSDSYCAEINSAQEVPPTGSTATGTAALVVDTAANTVTYHITFGGLSSSEIAAHIHGPAGPGQNAGIKHPLPLGSPKTGTWFYAESDEVDILAGRMYINIHSVNFGAGEIRGQVLRCVADPDFEPGPDSDPPGVPGEEGGTDEDLPDDDSIFSTYLATGEFHLSQMDMRIRGRGFDFVWERKYRSRFGLDTAQGNGWDFPYNIYLEADDGDLLLHDGNTRVDRYRVEASGCYARDEFFREIEVNAGGSHTLWFSDTGRWEFLPFDHPVAPGKIAAIVDRNGNTMSFGYDGAGRLVLVTDTLGRPIQIAYDGAGKISTLTDFTGRQVVFGYSGAGDLISARSPVVTGTPNGNDFPAGKTTFYTYSSGFADEELNHNLLTITDPKGQTWLSNTYAATTNPADLDYDRLIRQVWGNPGDIVDVVYVPQSPNGSNGQATIKAIVNDRVGNVKELFYEAGRRLVLAREFTGRADPDQPTSDTQNRPGPSLRPDDPAYFETRWSWNADKLCTEVVPPNGNRRVQHHELDLFSAASRLTRGNLRQRIREPGPLGGDQAQLVESFTYAPGPVGCGGGTSFVTSHADPRGNVTSHAYDGSYNRVHTTHAIGVEDWEYDGFGQTTAHVWPANGSGTRRRDVFTYYSGGFQAGYRQSEIVDASGFALASTYEYDARGNPVRIVDARGNDSLATYNQLDQVVRELSSVVDGVRYESLCWYDTNDNLIRTDLVNRDHTGALVGSNTHWSTIREYEILDLLHCTAEERLPVQLANSSLSCGSFPAGTAILSRTWYDENRNIRLVESPEAVNGNRPGDTVTTLHDERDLVFQTIFCAGDPELQSTTQADYDWNGNIRVQRAGLEGPYGNPPVPVQTTLFAHDGYDRLVSTTDPMGNVTTRHYDANRNLLSERVDGQLVDVEGSAGNVRLLEQSCSYDGLDRLTRTDVAHFVVGSGAAVGDGLSRTLTEYADDSQVTRTVDDRGNASTTTYDSASRIAVLADAKGNTITYVRDANGNVVSEASRELSDLGSPPQVFTTTRVFDALDRLREERDNVQNLTVIRYDSRSNPVRAIDPRGTESRADVDGVDRVVASVIDLDGDGADGSTGADGDIVIGIGYDDDSNLVLRRDDGGNETVEELDARDQSRGTDFADCTEEARIYDVHGNLVFERDANGTETTSTFDLLNRLRARGIVPGPNVAPDTTFELYDYDGLGRLFLAQDDDSIVTRAYDSLGCVLVESLNGLVTQFTYDGLGNQVSCTSPAGRTVTRTYDSLNRLKTVSDNWIGALATYEYFGPDRIQRRDLTGNGTRSSYEYDGIPPNAPGDFGVKQVVRTQHVRVASGAILDDRSYMWDPMGNKLLRKDDRSGGPRHSHDYTYDRAQRMTQALVRDGGGATKRSTTYDLDGVGNRESVSGAGSYDAGSYLLVPTCDPRPADLEMNQYTRTPVGACAYDSAGNLSAQGVTTTGPGPLRPTWRRSLLYDFADRLVEARASNSPARHSYHYDALGRRIEKIVNAHSGPPVTRFVYDGWQVIEERDEFAALASYVWGASIDEPLTMRRGADYFYHSDDLGNVMALSNGSGSVVERYEYDDYGRPLNPITLAVINGSPSPLGNPYLFQGHRYDLETGFYEYRTRYLDPRAGRFISRDSIGIWEDGANLGNGDAFVGNNPFSRLDPLGTKTKVKITIVLHKDGDVITKGASVGNAVGSALRTPWDMLPFTAEDYTYTVKSLDEATGKINMQHSMYDIFAAPWESIELEELTIAGHGGPGSWCGMADSGDFSKEGSSLNKFIDAVKGRWSSSNNGVVLRLCNQATGEEGKKFMLELSKRIGAKVRGWDDTYEVVPRGTEYTASPDGTWTKGSYYGKPLGLAQTKPGFKSGEQYDTKGKNLGTKNTIK